MTTPRQQPSDDRVRRMQRSVNAYHFFQTLLLVLGPVATVFIPSYLDADASLPNWVPPTVFGALFLVNVMVVAGGTLYFFHWYRMTFAREEREFVYGLESANPLYQARYTCMGGICAVLLTILVHLAL